METKKEYEIEYAMDTLLKAEEIKKDKKLMTGISKMLDKKQKNISDILRNLALKISKK